jgi:hypothetical protein
MDHAINGVPYERKTDTDVNRVIKQDATDYLANVLAIRDRALEDVCDSEIDKASAMINILNEKITKRMNT